MPLFNKIWWMMILSTCLLLLEMFRGDYTVTICVAKILPLEIMAGKFFDVTTFRENYWELFDVAIILIISCLKKYHLSLGLVFFDFYHRRIWFLYEKHADILQPYRNLAQTIVITNTGKIVHINFVIKLFWIIQQRIGKHFIRN